MIGFVAVHQKAPEDGNLDHCSFKRQKQDIVKIFNVSRKNIIFFKEIFEIYSKVKFSFFAPKKKEKKAENLAVCVFKYNINFTVSF